MLTTPACNALVDFFCSLALGCVVYGLQMEERQNALRKHRFLAILLGRGITLVSSAYAPLRPLTHTDNCQFPY